MDTKLCARCGKDKPTNEFYLKGNGKLHSWCNICRKEEKKEWDETHREHRIAYRNKNKDHILERNKQYRLTHKEELRIKANLYNEISKQYRKEKRKDPAFKLKRREYEKQWRLDNKEHVNQYVHDYYEKDTIKKIIRNMRNKARKILKGEISPIHANDMFGCDYDFFKAHIESQFTEGMHWGNYGFGADKWNIHHTPPLASYDYSNPDNFAIAFRWDHCSPKWTLENISENSWYEGVKHTYKKQTK